jgi:aryl-alcohol dehydrogenase-like predicted oxidoreductase
MERRALGHSGLETIPLMLGGNVFGWTADREASFAVLDAFADGGGTLIDSADNYSAWVAGNEGGESERMIGDWLRSTGRRSAMLVATKVGLLPGTGGRGLSASRIAAACDESLARLGTDVIDLYFAHRDDPDTPLEETIEAFDRLVRAGKVRAIGASNYAPDRLTQAMAISDAHGWARFAVIEPHYNLIHREGYEGPLQQLAIREGLGVVPYFGLASGYLTGKYRTEADIAGHSREPWLRPHVEGRGPALLAVMDDISRETGAPLGAIALAWLRAQPGISAPIASATKAEQVTALIAGLDLTLNADQRARLDRAA